MTNTKKVIVIESWETWNLCPPLKKEPEIPFKIIQADECPDYFTQALTSAKQRLLIIAPWLKNSVINDDLESKLTQLLSKNVKVLIGYGFEETDEDSHSAAIERINQLATKFDHLHFKFIGLLHEKILAYDDQFYINGSFNWLSFAGPTSEYNRSEECTVHFSPNVIDVRFRHWSQRFNGVNINSNHASLKNYILWRFNDNPRRDIDCPIRLAHSSLPVWDMLAPPITLFLSDNLNYEEVKIQIWQAGKILASEILTDLPIKQNGTQVIVHIQPLLGKVGFFGKLRLDFALTSPELILQKDTLPEFIWFPNIEVTFEPDPRFPELIACAKLASQSTDLTSMDVTPHLPQTQRLNGEQLGVSAPFQQSMVSCNLVIGDVTVSAEIKLPPLQNCYQDMLWQYQQKLREKQYTFDQLRKIRGQFSKELNQTPERHLLLAEVAYQIGRESRVSLDDAVRHLINYRQACQQLDVIEDTVAVSLDLIICLQRGKLIQSTSGDLQLDTLISRMELVQAYLNTPLQQWAKTIDWDWNYSPLKVLHQSDRVYLDLCLAQAQQNTMMARRKLTKLAKYQTHFFKLELLEARQFLLEGKQSEAQTIYQILRENLSQDSLYQHNFEEIMRFT